ncbi:DUF1934 domain-containing protein [Companilactobacillus keshanensis]|uniref:DUF1934 domain-containing protein n=1 Tax=Companilactobacillus keshanensis TaxID=2486003 RepID=A0ABW4BQC6_9LACO|nr:DUF1934 domain-containing protein [Companilactobacillus keshanensis]
MENNSLDVNVELNMEVSQAGELTHTRISELGKLTRVGSSTYLRFNEKLENNDQAKIMVKVADNGEIHLKRVAEATNLASLLYFTNQEHNSGHLQTEYGIMPLQTFTRNSQVEILDRPLSGKINIDYDLIYDNNIVGNYKFRLIFKA